MSKKEKNGSQATHIISLVIFILAYLSVVYFIQVLLNGRLRAEINSGKYTGEDLIRQQSILSAFSGILAQIQVLLSTFIVLATKKKGYIAAVILNGLYSSYVLMSVVKGGHIASLPGIVIPLSTVILITIIYAFSNRIAQKSDELSKSYDQIMESNRLMRDKDEKLTYLAYYDILTSLPNRHLFIEKLDESIVNNSDVPFTVILADLDNFKIINNTYGASSGDVLLATYAEKFKAVCGDSVTLGRIGGNEYGFILQGNMSEANILNFIQKIQTVLAEPVQVGSDIITTTASFGIASYPNNAVSSSELLTCISSAVSYAKSNGKNRPCFYEQY